MYTPIKGAWMRFGWMLLWGAVATAGTYAAANLSDLVGSLAQATWWPAVVPTITALLAAVSKWATEKSKE
jgi:hypothetical protein